MYNGSSNSMSSHTRYNWLAICLRYKWLVICFLIIFIFLCLPNTKNITTYPNTFINPTARNHIKDLTLPFQREDSKEIDASEEPAKKPLPLYYVESKQCKIPFIDPFAEEIMKIFKPKIFDKCSNESDLVVPVFDVIKKRYVLQINENVAFQILNSSVKEFNCYYQEITRDVDNDSCNDLLPPIYFSQGYVVPLHVQGFILSCHEAANTSNIIQKDGYSFIQYKPPAMKKPDKSAPRKPSVIMFGIDSMSRINVRRTMPKTYKFLTRKGWFEMQGYNKVGDNTFPNLMAILSGYLPDSVKEHVCDTDKPLCFDRIPFIWKYLKEAGYLTAYAEDWCGINTFNYVKPGFYEQPTDYYCRPYLKGFENNLEETKCKDCDSTYCIGRRIRSSYVYDYGRDFAKRYVDEQPVWGLFWSSSFSHDDYALPSKMDSYVLQYMLDFEQDGVFDQNIVIFFSDHGSRYGTLTSLTSGFLEERLPMMFIYLPPWFRAKYPAYTKALQVNQNRLSSNYDLHNTLLHIVEMGNLPGSPTLPQAYDCPKCHSLFYPINETRTCVDAAISEHYCTCVPYKRIQAGWADRIAHRVIGHINEYLWQRNFSSLCANLSLSYVHKTEIKITPEMDFHDEMPHLDVASYRTKFKVQQNSADFYATVVFNNITEAVEVDVETISRTNAYEEDSPCIADKLAKLYCICLSALKSD